MENFNTIEAAAIALFFIGIYGVTAKNSIVKSILSITIMEVGIILFFLGSNFKIGLAPPIGDISNELVADPLPQALMITTIVIGVAVTAVTLSMFIAMYHKYGTHSWTIARENRLKDD